MSILKEGSSGPEVIELQESLKNLGFNPGIIDGDFGPTTKAAVIAFQNSKELLADGIVGLRTKAALGLLRLGMTLSGGGFRATLFHLGVVRLLHDTGLLPVVKRIGAVSGGSVLAAHVVLHWDSYTGDKASFESAAEDIITFVRLDVRGRVVRRWILAWLTIIPRLFPLRHWTCTNLLQRFYERLYKGATLSGLQAIPGAVDRPEIFFYCTSLSTGSVCSFNQSGFVWTDDKGKEQNVPAPATPIAFAVAASSAFPPLFPPIAISNEALVCDRREFLYPQYLTDGGIYDNLGIDRLIWDNKLAEDLDLFLISDAEGNFDFDFDKKFTFHRI
jgi:predicted acylesterase/phospholipase RssA